MKSNQLISALFIVCFFLSIQSQNKVSRSAVPAKSFINGGVSKYYTPGGIFDTLYDQFGKKHYIEDLLIKPEPPYGAKTASMNTGSPQPQGIVSFTSCNSGYFKLFFETGCGMEGSSNAEQTRRNVICQVFYDISQFISSPLSSNGGKVNIMIRDMANMGVTNPSNNITLGLGSCFYCIPAVQNIGGIADNLIWQTITTGSDALTGVANPLVAPAIGGGGNFYHGMLSFNFANPVFNWNALLGSAPAANEYDLYTVALHEIAHSMGFGSLIDQTGLSKMGPTFPYYDRYDTRLKTQSNLALVTQSANACVNAMYNWYWNSNVPISALQPPPNSPCLTDNTACGMAINFSGSTIQPVYTPNCFSGGSSLSHFEDQCAPLTPGNNLYFVMSNANNVGPLYMKRYFKPEERLALCDIGYSCGTGFGSSVNLNNFSYSGPVCAGAQVGGINDGINAQGLYTFVGNVNSGIVLSGLLSNDHFTSATGNTFKCLQVISGTGNLSTVSGVVANYVPTSPGLHLLRYIPLDGATAKEGNITYVFVYAQLVIPGGTCVPTSCNILNNGGFESGSGCGQYSGDPISINCWEPLSGTPDRYLRSCVAATWTDVTVPTGTFISNPPSDSWSNGVLTNNSFVGLWGWGSGESLQTKLNSNLMPNTQYILSFWAKHSSNTQVLGSGSGADLVFAGATNTLGYNSSNVYTAVPAPASQLFQMQVPFNTSWTYFSVPFSFTTPTPYSYFYIFNVGWFGQKSYLLVDDFSITPADTTFYFNPPDSVCYNSLIPNLSNFVSIPGGIFSGQGVSLNTQTGYYEFNPTGNLNPGHYIIAYTYTLNGCSKTIAKKIAVRTPPNFSVIPASGTICPGQHFTLSAVGDSNIIYNWSNASTNPSIVVTPASNTIYTLTGTNVTTGCSVQRTVSVHVNPCLGIAKTSMMEDIKVFPNPFCHKLSVVAPVEISICIYNALGMKVLESVVPSNSHDMDLDVLANGYYLLKTFSKFGSREFKLIKVD